MVKPDVNQEVLASAARGASSGVSNPVNGKFLEYAQLVIYITAKTGTPTLSVSLQCSPVDPNVDGSKWRTIYQEPTITNAMIGTTFPKIFGGHRQASWIGWLRIAYTIAGGTITFSANMELK